MTPSTIFKFVRRRRKGTVEYPTIKDAFDEREQGDEVGIVLIATGNFYTVLRP